MYNDDLTLKKEDINGFTIMRMQGKLDLFTTEEFKAAVKETYPGPESIAIFDMKDLTYIDSSGIGVFILLWRNQFKGQSRILCFNPPNIVRSVFELTKITQFIPLFDTEDAALEAAKKRL